MDMQAFQTVRQMAAGFYTVRTLHVVTELGVADVVGDAPVAVADVARQVGANADALGRVVRLLASNGVFTLRDGMIGHSATSAFLRKDHPASLASFVRMMGARFPWNAVGEMMHVVKTGEAVENLVHPDGGFWGYLGAHPEQGRIFDEAMNAKAQAQIGPILAAYDFSRFGRVVDVGGGSGHFLAGMVESNPGVAGVLFDLPAVIERARNAGAGERLELVAGDFFETNLPKGDAYVLMEVLHDWGDGQCARILDAVRRVSGPDTRVLVIEIALAEGEGPDWSKQLDILMMTLFGARQRTNAEYGALLAGSGFVVEKATPAGEMIVIEARPA